METGEFQGHAKRQSGTDFAIYGMGGRRWGFACSWNPSTTSSGGRFWARWRLILGAATNPRFWKDGSAGSTIRG